ncbi:collagen-like protein [Capnocytophaga sputigena]|uniref:collagen-like protein n=1 Tax=Capnocytophaga sputigena TaxID=1019 RepID=UPI0028D2CE80|nr:collagen-like protein [Capnocytophaga sputigena]
MKKIILMAVAVLGALAINSCRKETETIIERVEVQKGNQILSGIGAPTETLGNVGDYYLDLSNSNLYGAKTAQGWGNPISLKGIQGDKGEKGDTGATGQKGDKGDTGATGQKGEKGDTGATGQKGEKGDTGATGQKGEKGNTGATGQKGDKGDTGATGQKGDKGDTGTPGQNGSKIYAGIGAPTINIGAVGDWYIDSQNKRLYGPKETSGWSNEYIPLTVNSEIRDSDYVLSEDKKDLTKWLNGGTRKIDMNSVPELRSVIRITAPNGISNTPPSFQGCTELKSIILSDNIIYITRNAFKDVKKLETVTIKSKIEKIDDKAFYGCDKLKSIIIEAKTPPILGDQVFWWHNPNNNNYDHSLFYIKIYVPTESIEIYKKAQGWANYRDKIYPIP